MLLTVATTKQQSGTLVEHNQINTCKVETEPFTGPPFASKLEQVEQVNSASYPSWDGK